MKIKLLSIVFLLVTNLSIQAQQPFQVVVKGKGDPILLFPGFGCTGEVWDDLVKALSKTNQCHVFTFAGFGKVAPIETPWLISIKQGVLDYVKKEQLVKPILLGHSLGGTLSLWLASEQPTLFKKIIAVDALPATAALMIPNYNGTAIAYDNPQSKMMLNMSDAAFAAMNAQSVPMMCKNTEKQKVLIDWMNQVDRKTYVYGYIDMLNLDLREAIGKINIPVTVLAAANPDIATVEKTYQSQFAKLPATKFEYAENSAHFIMFDQPNWLINKVTTNLK